jgi:hypothetical protein
MKEKIMLNLLKAGLVALAIGGVGLAGLAPAQAATIVTGGPGYHIGIQTSPGYGYYHHRRHFHHRHPVRICRTHWRHHHRVRICETIWR